MPPRRRSAPQDTHNEAAQLADRIQQAGYIKRDIARIINRDPSLVSQFYTRGKGAAFVTALREVLTAIETAGITELPELAAIAARHIQRRTTASGSRARVRGKAVLITPSGSGTGRAGAQAIASGSARLRPLIAEAARRGLRLAFTVRLAKTGYLLRLRPPRQRRSRRRHRSRPPMARGNRAYPCGRPHPPPRNPHLAPRQPTLKHRTGPNPGVRRCGGPLARTAVG